MNSSILVKNWDQTICKFLFCLIQHRIVDTDTNTAITYCRQSTKTIDIESLQNRLLKVCYVPATSSHLSRLLFYFFFATAMNSTNEANKSGGMCH